MLGFILADLRRQWIGALAVALLIACATALGVVVTLQERALRLGSARAAAAFDLVVGAPGGETQLVLSAIFLQPAPLPLLPGRVLAGLLADPRVAWAAPVGFGDFVDTYPIVGTTQPLVDGLGGLSEGRPFARLGEAILGAQVTLPVGARFHPLHGQVHGPGAVHGGVSYQAVGRLKPSGTPWDRAVLVPIAAVWQVHGHKPLAAAAAAAAHDHDADHVHDHAGDLDAPIRPELLADPRAPGVPAIVVKPRTIADAYKLRGDLRTEQTLAVFPAEVLTRLYGTLGDARAVLSAVALGAEGLVLAAILLVVVLHVAQRRRQIGALRAFGAPRVVICALVWLEVMLVLAAGLLAGFALGYGATRLLSGRLAAESGVALPVVFLPQDGAVLLLLLGVGSLAALIPALLAYGQSPARALRAD